MPYTVSNPPKWLKNLPKGAIRIGVETFNRVLKESDGDEDQARMAAWRNIKLKYRKVGDKWVKKASAEENSIELTFFAAMHSLKLSEEGNYATFYLMNTSRNRNRWGVTDKALEDALPTILNVALGAGPDYKIDKHYKNPLTTGFFVKGDKPDGYALGTALISDVHVWDKLSSGDWGPISVAIKSYRDVCSKCGADLTREENPFEHDHIKKGDGYVKVESFKFSHVDFINVPAYPQAGLLKLSAEGEETVPLELLARLYTSQSLTNFGRGAGSPRQLETRREKGKGKLMSETELQAQIEQLTEQVTTLETEKADLTAQLAEKETLKVELKTVKGELKAIADERHAELIEAAVEARWKAGLCTDKAKESKALEKRSDATLRLLAEDAGKVIAKIEAEKPSPKLKYSATDVTDFDKAVIDMRAQLGFKARPKKEENA